MGVELDDEFDGVPASFIARSSLAVHLNFLDSSMDTKGE